MSKELTSEKRKMTSKICTCLYQYIPSVPNNPNSWCRATSFPSVTSGARALLVTTRLDDLDNDANEPELYPTARVLPMSRPGKRLDEFMHSTCTVRAAALHGMSEFPCGGRKSNAVHKCHGIHLLKSPGLFLQKKITVDFLMMHDITLHNSLVA